MTDIKTTIINEIYSNKSYQDICKKICSGHNSQYADDLMQEVAELILKMSPDKLPPFEKLRFWFYRTGANMMSKTGTLGKNIIVNESINSVEKERGKINDGNDEYSNYRFHIYSLKKHNPKREVQIQERVNEAYQEKKIKTASRFMMSLSEFENRLFLLFNEHRNVAEISRLTGIKERVLRYQLSKIKQKAQAFA